VIEPGEAFKLPIKMPPETVIAIKLLE
jgi:hypothetical protein